MPTCVRCVRRFSRLLLGRLGLCLALWFLSPRFILNDWAWDWEAMGVYSPLCP